MGRKKSDDEKNGVSLRNHLSMSSQRVEGGGSDDDDDDDDKDDDRFDNHHVAKSLIHKLEKRGAGKAPDNRNSRRRKGQRESSGYGKWGQDEFPLYLSNSRGTKPYFRRKSALTLQSSSPKKVRSASKRLKRLSKPRGKLPKAGPGPASYSITHKSLATATSGGVFSTAVLPTFIDNAERNARDLPSSADYTLKGREIQGGTISIATPKSDVDWLILKNTPGPGTYESAAVPPHASSANFGDLATTDNWIDIISKHANEIPGPLCYDT